MLDGKIVYAALLEYNFTEAQALRISNRVIILSEINAEEI